MCVGILAGVEVELVGENAFSGGTAAVVLVRVLR